MTYFEEELINDFHSKMQDLIKRKCPLCENRLEVEDLGDEENNKIVLYCTKCEYSRRLK